jgi:hypothetical protein
VSNVLLNAAWKAPCRSAAQKLVLLRLADRADETGVCWPSVQGLAIDCGLSERSVTRAIAANKADMHISVKPTARTSQYHVHPRQDVTPDKLSPLTGCPRPLTNCPITPDRMSPKPSVTHKNPKGGASRFKPPTIAEVLLEASKNGLPESEARKFHAYYASKGWLVGRSPMKSWRQALTGWRIRWESDRRPAGTQSPAHDRRALESERRRLESELPWQQEPEASRSKARIRELETAIATP